MALVLLTSCESLTPEQRDNVNQTGSLVARKAAGVAAKILLQSAIGAMSGDRKEDFLHSAALGLRSEMGSIITANDVQEVVKIWTPKQEPGFAKLASDLGRAYKSAIQNGAEPMEAVEAVAVGLQDVAK